jgi:hypothetical protein
MSLATHTAEGLDLLTAGACFLQRKISHLPQGVGVGGGVFANIQYKTKGAGGGGGGREK